MIPKLETALVQSCLEKYKETRDLNVEMTRIQQEQYKQELLHKIRLEQEKQSQNQQKQAERIKQEKEQLRQAIQKKQETLALLKTAQLNQERIMEEQKALETILETFPDFQTIIKAKMNLLEKTSAQLKKESLKKLDDFKENLNILKQFEKYQTAMNALKNMSLVVFQDENHLAQVDQLQFQNQKKGLIRTHFLKYREQLKVEFQKAWKARKRVTEEAHLIEELRNQYETQAAKLEQFKRLFDVESSIPSELIDSYLALSLVDQQSLRNELERCYQDSLIELELQGKSPDP